MSSELTNINRQVGMPVSSASLLDMRMDARTYPRLGTFKRDDAIVRMSRIVTEAFMWKGQTTDPQEILFISTNMVDELQADMDNLGTRLISFEEISVVVKKAVITYEYKINLAFLLKTILDYARGEGHKLSKEAQEKVEKIRQERLRNSSINPMTDVYASRMVESNKINKRK